MFNVCLFIAEKKASSPKKVGRKPVTSDEEEASSFLFKQFFKC